MRYELGRGPAKQGFYQCNWDVLSVYSDEPDSDSDEGGSVVDSTTNYMAQNETGEQGIYECDAESDDELDKYCGPVGSRNLRNITPTEVMTPGDAKDEERGASSRQSSLESSGSATGLALRTDETAESRSIHINASWHGPMSKPAVKRGWPAKRRAQKSAAVGTQTNISVDGEGKWIGIDQVKEEIDPFVFSDDDISGENDSDDDGFDDDLIEDDIEYTDGEISAIAKQKATPDDTGFHGLRPARG